jgi:hypothetical protein
VRSPNRLNRAREFVFQRDSIKAHPLRDTHANDVPVICAEFARLECEAFAILDGNAAGPLKFRIAELERDSAYANQHCMEAVGVTHEQKRRIAKLEHENVALQQKVSDMEAERWHIYSLVIHAAVCHQGDDTTTARKALGEAHAAILAAREEGA